MESADTGGAGRQGAGSGYRCIDGLEHLVPRDLAGGEHRGVVLCWSHGCDGVEFGGRGRRLEAAGKANSTVLLDDLDGNLVLTDTRLCCDAFAEDAGAELGHQAALGVLALLDSIALALALDVVCRNDVVMRVL